MTFLSHNSTAIGIGAILVIAWGALLTFFGRNYHFNQHCYHKNSHWLFSG